MIPGLVFTTMTSLRLRAKFLILVLGILIVFIGALSIVIVRRETRILARKGSEKEHLLARTIVADLRDSMLAGRPRSTLALMRSLEGISGIVSIAVLRPDGTPAFDVPGPAASLPQFAEALAGRDVDFDETGPELRHVNLFPLRNEALCQRCHGREHDVLAVVLISNSLNDTAAEIASSERHLLGTLFALLAVMATALYVAVRKVVLDPLRKLHQGSVVIGNGDLSHSIEINSGDEFQDLAASFNDMAARVRETRADLETTVRIRTAELNESVRLMRGILSSMSIGVTMLDREGTVKLMNRQGACILGRGHEDLLGRRLVDVVPETTAFRNVRVGTYGEIVVRISDVFTTPVGFTASRYSGGAGPEEGLIVVFQDLTELGELQRAAADKERSAAMWQVAAGMAHKIGNLLLGISSVGRIFEHDLREPAHQELVRMLLAEAKRLNELVEELVILGRPMNLKLEDGDLRVLWDEVLTLHRDKLQRQGIRVRVEGPVQHLVARFDHHQVRQVFLKLVINAVEAMPNGGEINIMMLAEGQFAICRISDTGPGIPSEQLDHVFDLFFTTKPKGMGLGLAICRKILQDHGGDIIITSGEGAGTTATVRLPVEESWAGRSAAIRP
jgi:nitrogen fixation/metabolism regulation signal transduction histidine kinase